MALLDPQHRSTGEAAHTYLSGAEILFGQRRDESDIADIWSDFETHRQSAEYYLNRYFESLDQVAASCSSWDHPTGSQSRPSDDGMSQIRLSTLDVFL